MIDVNLPISGSINDPNFSIRWRHLAGHRQPDRVKIVTSPFALFSGGGGEGLRHHQFPTRHPVMANTASVDDATKPRRCRSGRPCR